ncbi:MAG: hypothetical protein BMS9Abin32_218 [Gammaproteobacteria bacterium]|nr:MAG: hypothetical protein BMS9Abin32_218 [Gammaproteobacteria bacterium]
MAIDDRTSDLINAGIDGEISPGERIELDRILRESAAARQYQADLTGLCDTLDATGELAPPPHLQHAILGAVKRRKRSPAPVSAVRSLLGLPMVRYAGAFSLGIILALAVISSDRISRDAFDDVTGLVGTLSGSTTESMVPNGRMISVSSSEIAGSVRLRRAAQIVVIDFDLVSSVPIEIVAEYADPEFWFNGFAQLENTGTRVFVEPGKVTLVMEGKRRYALYLHRANDTDATVDLSFFASGRLIREETLHFRGAD